MINWPIVEIPGEEEGRPARPLRQRKPPYDPVGHVRVPNRYRNYGLSNPHPGTFRKFLESEGWIPLAVFIGLIVVGGGILMHITGNGAAYWGLWLWFIQVGSVLAGPVALIVWCVHKCNRQGIPWVLGACAITLGAILLASIF